MKYYFDGTMHYSPGKGLEQVQQEISQMTTKEKWDLVRESFGTWKNSDDTNWAYVERGET